MPILHFTHGEIVAINPERVIYFYQPKSGGTLISFGGTDEIEVSESFDQVTKIMFDALMPGLVVNKLLP